MTNYNHQHVFLVDDEPEVCKVIGETLEKHGINITCFTSGRDCLKQLDSKRCDLLITDLKMPEIDGIELMIKARHIVPWLPIIIITGYGDIPTAVTTIKNGAVDFIEKPLETESFVSKVKSILQENHNINNPTNKPLTKMEMRVLKLLIKGKSSKEIAYSLNRSDRTVEVHRARIMKKLGVSNIIDLIKRVALMGLIELPNNHPNHDILDDEQLTSG